MTEISRDTTWGAVREILNDFMANPVAPGTINYNDLLDKPTLGSAAATSATAYATAAQGELADTAVQPGELAPVATSGDYGDLVNKPTLGTAAAEDSTAFATAAEGDLAVSALQPGVTTTDIAEGNRLYFTEARARATVLTGFSTSTSIAISTSDTVISAFGKAQAQINSLASEKFDKTGGAISGDVNIGEPTDTAGKYLNLDAADTANRGVAFKAGGIVRYQLFMDAGANLVIARHNAGGTPVQFPFILEPSTGRVNLDVRPYVSGGGDVETRGSKGVANGYAPLGADNLVPSSYLPVNGAYKGTWNASTNTPALTTTPSTNGDYYIVSVAGTQSVTGVSTAFALGDQLRSNGTAWQRIPSVNAVNSVFGRTGVIAAASGDYSAAQITYGATNVGAALDARAPLASPSFTGTASFADVPNFAGARAPMTGVLGSGAALSTLVDDGFFRLTSGHPDLPDADAANGSLTVANGSAGDVVSQILVSIGTNGKTWVRTGTGIETTPVWVPWRWLVTSTDLLTSEILTT